VTAEDPTPRMIRRSEHEGPEAGPGGVGAPQGEASAQFLGQFLLGRGLINEEDLEDGLAQQDAMNLPIGALALSKGFLSEKQLLHVHGEQRRTDRLFGEIAVRRGFLTQGQLDELLKEQKEGRVFLGDVLVEAGTVTREVMDRALEDYLREQRVAERRVAERLRGLDESGLLAPSVQLTTRLLLRVGGLVAKPAAVESETRFAGRDYVFWQEVGGDQSFTYALAFDGPDLLTLCKGMLIALDEDDEVPTEVDLLALDVGKEFVNVVVGHLCTWLSRQSRDTMPLPPDAGEGDIEVPTGWSGPSKRVNVRLVLPRGEAALSLVYPAS